MTFSWVQNFLLDPDGFFHIFSMGSYSILIYALASPVSAVKNLRRTKRSRSPALSRNHGADLILQPCTNHGLVWTTHLRNFTPGFKPILFLVLGIEPKAIAVIVTATPIRV